MEINEPLKEAASFIAKSSKNKVKEESIWYAIQNSINPQNFISNLSEVLRVSAEETEELISKAGLGSIAAQAKMAGQTKTYDESENLEEYIILDTNKRLEYEGLFDIEFFPSLNTPIKMQKTERESFASLVDSLTKTVNGDPFLALYRKGVLAYHDDFIKENAPKIDKYISDNFKEGQIKYLINSGIGGNEQANHYVANYYNTLPNKKFEWFVWDSPRHLLKLPKDANIENTLFMEFSRSGKTEETVKLHEYTPRNAKRIVFANSGPLKDLGIRDNNLILELPDEVAGRFGRNKTPTLLAVMYVAGLDTKPYWQTISNAIKVFDLTSKDSLPMLIAQYIYLYQLKRGLSQIYLGCNDDLLLYSADEFMQFWDEGVTKNNNDFMLSRYVGLPRDSHTVIEGILGNYENKMGIFLVRNKFHSDKLNNMVSKKIDPIDKDHAHLEFGDEEYILANANVQSFASVMPTIKIEIKGEPSLDHSAVLGQLWADITFCYSKLKNVDPGSNPAVKEVRDRSSKLLKLK